MSDERSAGGSSDDADLYNEMLRLEQMETLLEEIEELDADAASGLPPELQGRLASLGVADPSDLRHRVELLHASLDTVD